jgi:hypothetical protein
MPDEFLSVGYWVFCVVLMAVWVGALVLIRRAWK